MRIFKSVILALAVVLGLAATANAQVYTDKGANLSSVAGVKVAMNYEYTPARIDATGSVAAASPATFNITGVPIKLPDGRSIIPFFVGEYVNIGQGSTQEATTITAVSNCNLGAAIAACTVSANTVNAHGRGDLVASGTNGVGEAIYDAFLQGGGQVVVDGTWKQLGGVDANITNSLVFPSVGIVDYRGPAPVYWSPVATQSAGSYLAAPSTLTSGTVASSTTVAGSASYTGGTIHVCITYVDIMGNEGPCSADYSFTDTSAKAIVFQAPAASTGAVGWRPYIGLESGASGHEYLMPLVTQPSAIGSYPASNSVCTLTTVETFTPACAVANTSYGQSSSGAATITAYPVVTSQQAFQLGGVSSTSYYVPNTNAHNAYTYEPGAHPGLPGITASTQKFTASAALASTVPFVLGSINMPVGFMNYTGRTIQVCGIVADATGGANTVSAIQFWWDAQGSNVTTGIPVLIAQDKVTGTLTGGAAANYAFCQTFVTTTASASATGGSIWGTNGYISISQVAAGTTPFTAPNIVAATTGSLNLAEDARIDIVFVETTATTDTPQLLNATVTVLN